MKLELNNALYLNSEKKSFVGSDGREAKYTSVTILDDDNDFVRCTAPYDMEFPQEPRTEIEVTLELNSFTDKNGSEKIKRKIVDINY